MRTPLLTVEAGRVMPTYASGLSGQVGAVAESAYGTPVTVTHFYEFLERRSRRSCRRGSTARASSRAGTTTAPAGRVQSQFAVTGDLTMEHTSGEAATAVADSMGFWWKFALWVDADHADAGPRRPPTSRSTPTEASAGFSSITGQVGSTRRSARGDEEPFTYTGTKVTDWEFSCSDNQIAQLKVTIDGQTELTSTGLAAVVVS